MRYSMTIQFRRRMAQFAKPSRDPAERYAELPPATRTERPQHLRSISMSAAAELPSSERDLPSRSFPAFSIRGDSVKTLVTGLRTWMS